MQTNYVVGAANSALLDPTSSTWQQASDEVINLAGTPAWFNLTLTTGRQQ